MCGFTGFIDPSLQNGRDSLRSQVCRMAEHLLHRGPDEHDEWVDAAAGFALGHRRLSIIDLSPGGHQPMISRCGRYVIAFNGEIYNFMDLRQELESVSWAHPWRGHSDTEVLLAAVSHWGLEAALRRSNGMFAFALWDQENRELVLARDRLGEKPLYYGWSRGVLLFGSELKALRAHPAWEGEIDRDSLALYLRYNCVPAPHSIYRGIRKLPPATWMCVSYDQIGRKICGEPHEYWSAKEVVETGVANPFEGTEAEAEEALDALLRDAVRIRMYADVPLGAFLSGGIDSSTVVALMQAQSMRPVRTFTIGFQEEAYNEAPDAKTVAGHLGTEHTEHYVTAEETRQVIPLLPTLYDEPFADSSQIPTYLVSRMARDYVTVSLSGDGGDEIFGGYNRHFWVPTIWRRLRRIPRPVRRMIAAGIGWRSPAQWDGIYNWLSPIMPGWTEQRTPGYKFHKLAETLPARNPAEMYNVLTSHWKQPENVVIGSREPLSLARDPSGWLLGPDRVSDQMMYLDLVSYLPDDILVKVDRASMGVSLEGRMPFLDHRVVEMAWRLPLGMKIYNGEGKRILRNVLYRYVPRKLIERPKTGFGLPIDRWLRGPLRGWASELLDQTRLNHEGFFDAGKINTKWQEHLSGKRDWQFQLWDVLMFQAWFGHLKANS